ncbi:response regulator [Microbulbifer thermotolerans]|uniref:DNA-binding response regulator n=1 Tax=Microbulbifer thermotolerans TaxID=252514 RepID=A0A143HRB6_MICTH|nr:response regulator [Microbulbifer thermotolerans]AMX03950.1 DNA-binding response regulator [Microbulbifer thermotolerans]MCX2782926.1 response regulator [Microbulbifer thermotolerans]MCX2840903.1 response regulator [Microbulbifer thermotolerans]
MSDSRKTILVVEDEQKLSQLLFEYLQAAGYRAHCLSRADAVMPWLAEHRADLVILDLMLPGGDGMDLCREIRRQSQVPIIMSTARVEEADRLRGLETGADDYVCKPYSLREMVARVKVILRRMEHAPPSSPNTEEALFAIDPARMSIRVNGQALDLTRVEFRLLRHLIEHPGVVFSRDALLNIMYDDYRLVSERTIDSHIKNLRRKLSLYLPEKRIIHSIYGAGYRFELE